MAEITNTTTRRALIAGAATIPTAFALGSSLASAEGQTLANVIEAHRNAYARKRAAYDVEEAIEELFDEPMSEERKRALGYYEANARADEAADAEHDARMDVAAYRPANAKELQTKTAYMRSVDAFEEIFDKTSVAHYLVAAIDRQAVQS